jgi:hypothetical protein
MRLSDGLPVNTGDIGAKEHETYVAQGAESQTDYCQDPYQKGVELAGYALQCNPGNGDGQEDQNEAGQIKGGEE